MTHRQMRFWEFVLVAVLLIIVSLIATAQRAHAAPASIVTRACYFERAGLPADCKGDREEAEDYLAKRHWSCAAVVYVLWLQETTEIVRCRGFDGSVLDYVSGADGNLRFVK